MNFPDQPQLMMFLMYTNQITDADLLGEWLDLSKVTDPYTDSSSDEETLIKKNNNKRNVNETENVNVEEIFDENETSNLEGNEIEQKKDKKRDWHIKDLAFEKNLGISANQFSMERLEYTYSKYSQLDDDVEDAIGPTGIDALCTDISVNSEEDVRVLIFAYRLGAKRMGYFEKQEFISGMHSLRCDSADKLKKVFAQQLLKDLQDEKTLKAIWKYLFGFFKEDDSKVFGKRNG
eukprot:TRINITY_DN141_c0_g1_i2.p1 TRINITY_DN141_c0_g1~~TRINITY_DN141_c0_g1_i2.p1  ORF type:complete len:234 (-),score=56.85 TRINITY_DN141_c0_g1_i2:348-1049(-)